MTLVQTAGEGGKTILRLCGHPSGLPGMRTGPVISVPILHNGNRDSERSQGFLRAQSGKVVGWGLTSDGLP